MDIDAVIATIEYRLHTNDGATYHILNEDNEVMFTADEETAVREFEKNYLTADQLTALMLDLQVSNELRAEDAANRRISYTN